MTPVAAPNSSADVPSAPLYDPGELDEDVEIDAERRRRVLDLYYRLEDLWDDVPKLEAAATA